MGCEYKTACRDEVTRDTYDAVCMSETSKFIYCETYKRFLDPLKYPIGWERIDRRNLQSSTLTPEVCETG